MPRQRLEAGIAMGIVILFVGLLAGGIIFILMQQVTPAVLDQSTQYTQGTLGEKGASWLTQAFQAWPLYVLVVSFFGLIARATFQSKVT